MTDSRYTILDDRNGHEIRQTKFEAKERVLLESLAEARHRLCVLVNAGVVKPWQATIVRVDGDALVPQHW
jgi:hypothetical protein